jgi:ADP-ribose pyrophosphatase YjhB (NUDIX family)
LIDDQGRLVLIKRTKPGQAPYWTTPGGGIADTDASAEAALHRELAEELGAEAAGAGQVFLFSSPSDAGVAVQHFFVARLVRMDEAARSGPEFADPTRGGYDVDLVDLLGDDLARIDLKPGALKEFILANREALLAGLPRLFLGYGVCQPVPATLPWRSSRSHLVLRPRDDARPGGLPQLCSPIRSVKRCAAVPLPHSLWSRRRPAS